MGQPSLSARAAPVPRPIKAAVASAATRRKWRAPVVMIITAFSSRLPAAKGGAAQNLFLAERLGKKRPNQGIIGSPRVKSSAKGLRPARSSTSKTHKSGSTRRWRSR